MEINLFNNSQNRTRWSRYYAEEMKKRKKWKISFGFIQRRHSVVRKINAIIVQSNGVPKAKMKKSFEKFYHWIWFLTLLPWIIIFSLTYMYFKDFYNNANIVNTVSKCIKPSTHLQFLVLQRFSCSWFEITSNCATKLFIY